MSTPPRDVDERAKCRHCGRTITRRAGQGWWEDPAGFARCIKKAPDEVGAGPSRSGRPGHEPMPDGLDGAATPITPGDES